MLQPRKKIKSFSKEVETPKSKRRRKRKRIISPRPKEIEFWVYNKYKISKQDKEEKEKKKVTVSNLEFLFKRNFLDLLGIKYVHQWECPAKFIYDFAILTDDSNQIQALIEVQGTFYHCDPRIYKEGPIYENQKRQIQRDKDKMEWAYMNNYILLQIWEHDIHNNPKQVLEELKKRLIISTTKEEVKDEKQKYKRKIFENSKRERAINKNTQPIRKNKR